MTIALTQPIRTGNPGIVPPWLRDAAPTASTAPAAAPAAPSAMVASVAPASARDVITGAAQIGAAPVRGRVPATPDAGAARFEAQQQALLERTVAEVQARFRELGIRDDEGNGPLAARFNPRYPNASYAPHGIPEKNVPADSITVGMDPRTRTPFTVAKDVVAHELAHRIVHHMSGGAMSMSPFSQDVAIHESLADTFAALVDDDEWVIGDALVSPIRIMDAPERLGHPAHMDDLPRILNPSSGFMHPVGINPRTGKTVLAPDWHVVAGIPNKAATIIGDKLGRETLGAIYVNAMRNHVRPGGEIAGLAQAVLASTKELYGSRSREFSAAVDAWEAVGVLTRRGSDS